MRGLVPKRLTDCGSARARARRFRHAAVFALVMSSATSRATSSEGSLEVLRGPHADACPDGAELQRLISELRASSQPVGHYAVTFSKQGNGYHARIANLDENSVRELSDGEETCRGLARATAVTLALLFDAQVSANSSLQADLSSANTAIPLASKPQPRLIEAPTTTLTTPAKSGETTYVVRSSAWSMGVVVGPSVVTGVTAPVAPGLFGSVDVVGRYLRFDLGALATLPHSTQLGPGHVTLGLLAGALSTCVTPTRLDDTRVELCSGAVVGRIAADADGFTRDGQTSRAWVAIPVGLNFTSDSRVLAWQLGVGALVPVRQQDFRIEGLGTVYRSSAVAGFAHLRASARWLL